MGIEQRPVDEDLDVVPGSRPPLADGTAPLPRRVRPMPDHPEPPPGLVAPDVADDAWNIDDSAAFATGLLHITGQTPAITAAPAAPVLIQFDEGDDPQVAVPVSRAASAPPAPPAPPASILPSEPGAPPLPRRPPAPAEPAARLLPAPEAPSCGHDRKRPG